MADRAGVIFDTPPVIGHRYTLTDIYGQPSVTATLIKLVDKIDDFGYLPGTGRHVTQHNRYAIFECCQSNRRFQRVVVPEI